MGWGYRYYLEMPIVWRTVQSRTCLACLFVIISSDRLNQTFCLSLTDCSMCFLFSSRFLLDCEQSTKEGKIKMIEKNIRESNLLIKEGEGKEGKLRLIKEKEGRSERSEMWRKGRKEIGKRKGTERAQEKNK